MKKRKVIIIIALLLLFIVGYLFYSRPMTIQQRYPMLSLDKCTELQGLYKSNGQDDFTEFVFDKNSEEFEILCKLLFEQEYKHRLRDLLPRGTRYHQTQPNDYEWEVFFHFEDVMLEDGNIASGGVLSIQYWYGELDIKFDGETISCTTSKQDTWSKEVLNTIQ